MCNYCKSTDGYGETGLVVRLTRLLEAYGKHRGSLNASSVVHEIGEVIGCSWVEDAKAEEIWTRYQAALKEIEEGS